MGAGGKVAVVDRVCLICGAAVDQESWFCRNCGTVVEDQGSAPTESVPLARVPVVTADVTEPVPVRLPDPESEPVVEPAPDEGAQGRPGMVPLLIALAVVAGVLAAGIAVLLTRDSTEPDSAAVGDRIVAETDTETETTTSTAPSTTSTTGPTTSTTAAPAPPPGPQRPAVDEVPVPAATVAPSFSGRTIVRPGTGAVAAQVGDTVAFRFVGRLPSGDVFVDSWETDPGPVSFVLGSGELRAGLDEQLRGLVAGDRAEIVLGSDQAFGAEGDGTGAVPPHSPVAYLVDVFTVTGNP